jgi:LacI family transcriptional regulator
MAASIRQIAQQTGLSTATVSMALRGTGRLSPATRARVKKAAHKLGYQPNPVVTKAMTLARKPDASRYRETLAFVTEFPMKKAPLFQRELFASVTERAGRLGYKVEDFILSDKASEHRRLSRVLNARGIRGAIILPRVRYQTTRFYLDWKQLAALEIGRTIRNPLNLHRVERAIYYQLVRALHLLKKAGYRRIGFAIKPAEDSARWGIYSAAYLMYQQKVAGLASIPALGSSGPWNGQTLRKWLARYKPDVLVIDEYSWVCDWLQDCGCRWPKDVSIFSTNAKGTGLSGFHSDVSALGTAAVDMVSVLLENNELGLPAQPRNLLVNDIWQKGSSLRLPLPSDPTFQSLE